MNTSTESPSGTGEKSARMAGLLYILGTVAGILSLTLTGGVRNAQNMLAQVLTNENLVIMGALCILIMGLALAMIPVVLFPILRKYDEVLALGYVVFRGGLEAFTYLAMAISWLYLLPVSRSYVQSGASNPFNFQALGMLLLDAVGISALTTIIFCLGALMFYALLYRSQLVPRWLSGWGLAALIPYVASGLLVLFGVLDPLSTVAGVLNVPLALQEMVLAIWLIVKGFNPSPVTFGQAQGGILQS